MMKIKIQLFGGRGASSGISVKGKIYGSEYRTVLKASNIKFVKYNDAINIKSPMETRTKGRVYVTVSDNDIPMYITYYSNDGKRKKQIDLKHYHKNIKDMHTHDGYIHDELGTHKLTTQERKMVEYALNIWYNRSNGT